MGAVAIGSAVHCRAQVARRSRQIAIARGPRTGTGATNGNGLRTRPGIIGAPLVGIVAVFVDTDPHPAAGKTADPGLEAITQRATEGAGLGRDRRIGEHHRHAVRPARAGGLVGILIKLDSHQIAGPREEALEGRRGGLVGRILGQPQATVLQRRQGTAIALSHHPVAAKGTGGEVIAETGQWVFTHARPVAGEGLVDHLAVVGHGDVHRRHGAGQHGLATHGQIPGVHIENGVEFGVAAHGDLAEVIHHQVVGLAPRIDLHLVAQGQIALDVQPRGTAAVKDQLVVLAELHLVYPVVAATKVEIDVGGALVFERLEVAGLQISIEGAVAAHLQGLVKQERQVAATPCGGDPALVFHLEPIDGEGALSLEGHGTVALHPQAFDKPVPCPHEHALATGRDLHGDLVQVVRLEDGGPGIAIARDLKGAVDGDPGVIELALTSHRQIVHMKVSRPGDATVVTILDGHLLGIDGRTVEVEHRPFADRQGIEAIGLARFQGRHAAVAPPRGVLVVTGSRRDGPVASEIIFPAVGGEAPGLAGNASGSLMKVTSLSTLARAPLTLQLETQVPLFQKPPLLQLALGWIFWVRKG